MQTAKETFRFRINGKQQRLEAAPDTPLLYILRNQLALNGPKYGCGLGQCGACMILLDQQPIMSCTLPVKAVEGKALLTLAGLAQADGELHPVQQAFLDEQAAQCGYCINGMIMAGVSLLNRNPSPSDEEIRQSLQINLCRCGTQSRVVRALQNCKSGGAKGEG